MLLRYTAYDLNNSLSVAAKVYNYTSGSPVFIETVAMPPVGVNGSYVLPYTAPTNETFFANMMVYTDDSFDTPDTNYTPGDAEISNTSGGGGSTGEVCGTIIGFINDPQNIVGFVNCECD